MVSDYEYENLFAEHFATNLIIVDSGATVEINAGAAPTVSDEEFLITNEEIQTESFKLSESLCSERNLVFGKMEASKLTFTFKNNADYPSDLTEIEIDVYLYFNYDSSTLFKVGRYTINADKYSDDRYTRSITAYDKIYYLKDLDITAWYNEYYEDAQRHMLGLAILSLFTWINEEAEIDIELESGYNLCNGLFQMGKTIESDSISFEFFMQRVLEWNGAFGHINRDGKFEFVTMEWYDAAPVRTVTNDVRIPPTPFDMVSTWGIGGIDVYDADNIRKFSTRNTNKKKPSIYTIVDSFVVADRESGDSDVEIALKKLHQVINHYNYKSCKATCTGDLCVEVGDRINVNFFQEETDPRDWFRSYVLERTFSGIQGITDIYQSKGDQKQPAYTVTNNWHIGSSQTGTTGSGTGGVAEVIDEIDNKIIEIMRNYGLRVLDEPKVTLEYNKSSQQVEIKWEDPDDLATYYPVPLDWAGTIVVRKEGEKPLNRWNGNADGNTLVDSTTRDEYKTTAFVDNTIEQNKRYYYAIMPYHIALDDADHPIKYYRWTKVFSVDTAKFLVAPTIFPITVIEGTEMTIAYSIPVLESGSYAVQKLVGKKGSIPTSKTDGTVLVDLTPTAGMIVNTVTITGLDEESTYYFVIFIEDTDGNSASSEPQDAITGVDLGWNYDYTGAIQTFTAPKTGIYSLETWGAQGGDATDGTNTARGGYGAYAYGEVLLQQGETVYINVGGQNGYGGGGNYVSAYTLE